MHYYVRHLYGRSYLKSVLKYKLLTVATCRTDTVYICGQRCEDSPLFVKAPKRVRGHKICGKKTTLKDFNFFGL